MKKKPPRYHKKKRSWKIIVSSYYIYGHIFIHALRINCLTSILSMAYNTQRLKIIEKGGDNMIAKKCLLLLAAVLILGGCTMPLGPVTGSLYTDVKGPLVIDSDSAKGQMVEGMARAQGILGFATGDCSLEAAIKDALAKAPGSTRLENIIVDYHAKSILGVYAEFTTMVKGVPVK